MCDHHRLRHGVSQLTGRFLLQRGSRERRSRRFLYRFCRDVVNRKRSILAGFQKVFHLLLVFQAAIQFGFQHGRPVRQDEIGNHAERRLTYKFIDFPLTFHDQTHSHRLHTPGRQGWFYLTPQNRREFEPHDTVQHTARLLGVHQVNIDIAWRFNSMQNGILGNFMEDDTFGIFGLQTQYFIQMPGYCFSFTVLIGSEPHLFGRLGFGFQFAHQLLLVDRYHVLRSIVVFEVNTKLFRLQIADVTVARHNLIIFSEELFNGFCLSGRLHYYQILLHNNVLSI